MEHIVWNCTDGSRLTASCEISRKNKMNATKRTKAPEGFAYYRVCDPEGICRVVRGALAAQRLVEDLPHLSASRTKLYPVD